MQNLTLTRPDDWHLHLRDGEALKAVLPHTVRQFARAIIMPNLKPPVRSVADAAAYRDRIMAAIPTGKQFEPLMTLYLTDNTSPEEIIAAKASQFVKAVKYYPAGATTNSDFGVTDIRKCDRIFEVMEQVDIPLLLHGEVTDGDVDIFDREKVFIEKHLIPYAEAFASFYGADFYQLPRNTEQITLTKTTWRIPDEVPFLESGLVPLLAGQEMKWQMV
ncbi:MAG: hypothetical protein RLZZ535_2621 [Cyanobacteriota bacterium]|jgi:dihydroorotase